MAHEVCGTVSKGKKTRSKFNESIHLKINALETRNGFFMVSKHSLNEK